MRSLNSSLICIFGWLKSDLGVVLLCFGIESCFVFSFPLILEPSIGLMRILISE